MKEGGLTKTRFDWRVIVIAQQFVPVLYAPLLA